MKSSDVILLTVEMSFMSPEDWDVTCRRYEFLEDGEIIENHCAPIGV